MQRIWAYTLQFPKNPPRGPQTYKTLLENWQVIKLTYPNQKSPCIPKINPLRKKSGKELNQPKTYLEINLNKEMKDIDSENCKKKLRLTLEDGKISHAIGLVRLIL